MKSLTLTQKTNDTVSNDAVRAPHVPELVTVPFNPKLYRYGANNRGAFMQIVDVGMKEAHLPGVKCKIGERVSPKRPNSFRRVSTECDSWSITANAPIPDGPPQHDRSLLFRIVAWHQKASC